jgi:hypothetical protein
VVEVCEGEIGEGAEGGEGEGEEESEGADPLLPVLNAALAFVPECSPPSVVLDYVGFLRKGLRRMAARLTTVVSFNGGLGGMGVQNLWTSNRDADTDTDTDTAAKRKKAWHVELRVRNLNELREEWEWGDGWALSVGQDITCGGRR